MGIVFGSLVQVRDLRKSVENRPASEQLASDPTSIQVLKDLEKDLGRLTVHESKKI